MTILLAQVDAPPQPVPAASSPPVAIPAAPVTLQLPAQQRIQLENTRAIKLEQIDVKGPDWWSPEFVGPMLGVVLTAGILYYTTRKQIENAQATTKQQLDAAAKQSERESIEGRAQAHEQWRVEVLTTLVSEFADISHEVSSVLSTLSTKSHADAAASSSILNRYNSVTNKLSVWLDDEGVKLLTDLQTHTMQHQLRALGKAHSAMRMVARIETLRADIQIATAAVDNTSATYMEALRNIHTHDHNHQVAFTKKIHETAVAILQKTRNELREAEDRHGILIREYGVWNMQQQLAYGDLPALVLSAARRILGQDPLENYLVCSFRERQVIANDLYDEVVRTIKEEAGQFVTGP